MIPHRLQRYPFSIAYPARLFEIADDPADRLDKAMHFVELSATTLAVLGLAWCRAHGAKPGGVRQWEKKLDPAGITLGTWNATIRAAIKEMSRAAERDPVARAVRLAGEAAVPHLEAFNPTRNTYAHGGKPRTRGDQEGAVDDLERGVSGLLDCMEPLTNMRLGLVRATRANARAHLVDLDVMTGYAEPFPRRRLRSATQFEEGLVLAYHADSLDFAIHVSPYGAWGPCPECGHEELFYLHQRRKQRSFYFSFSSGHELEVKGDVVEQAARPAVALDFEPLGSSRMAAASGWRAVWADLAPRWRRLAARIIDLAAASFISGLGWVLGALLGLSFWKAALPAGVLLFLYEPVAVFKGGTLGKYWTRIEAISTWDGRALGRSDALRRALAVDLQLIFLPLAVRNLAWITWDPARQCYHDRVASSIVVSGRSRPAQKL